MRVEVVGAQPGHPFRVAAVVAHDDGVGIDQVHPWRHPLYAYERSDGQRVRSRDRHAVFTDVDDLSPSALIREERNALGFPTDSGCLPTLHGIRKSSKGDAWVAGFALSPTQSPTRSR